MVPHPRKTVIKKHNLDKKYKPWRKGKSANATSGASLKNQLRGKKRLLSRLLKDETTSEKSSSTKEALEVKIKELEKQIKDKEKVDKERSNAMKYHKFKFFDKKKLFRMEKKIKKEIEEAKSTNNKNLQKEAKNELKRIQDDLKYIAYFPNDQKYISIFLEGTKRVVDDPKSSRKRKIICERIEKEHGYKFKTYTFVETENTDTTIVTNVSKELSKSYPKSKSEQVKPQTKPKDVKKEKEDHDKVVSTDSRFDEKIFSSSSIVKQAELVEKALEEENNSEMDSGSGSNESQLDKHNKRVIGNDSGSESDSDSSSDSSSDSDDEDNSDDNSDSESSNESSSGSEGSKKKTGPKSAITKTKSNDTVFSNAKTTDDSDSDNDFFGTGEDDEEEEKQDDIGSIFEKAKVVSAHDVGEKGDKSKGWATQRQLPGDFKKKRRRRN